MKMPISIARIAMLTMSSTKVQPRRLRSVCSLSRRRFIRAAGGGAFARRPEIRAPEHRGSDLLLAALGARRLGGLGGGAADLAVNAGLILRSHALIRRLVRRVE